MTAKYSGNRLFFGSTLIHTFPFEIGAIHETEHMIVVLLRIPPGKVMTENVFAISPDGQQKWQIQRTDATASNPADHYTGILSADAEKVRLYNWNCCAVDVSLDDGRVLDVRVVR